MPGFRSNPLLRAIARKTRLERDDILQLLGAADAATDDAIRSCAYAVKTSEVARKVYFRGLAELGNICDKNCSYCGIRSSNREVERFQLTREEIVDAAIWAHQRRFGSIILQAGERSDSQYIGFVEGTLREIRLRTNGRLGITLSLGEQSAATYERWFAAGAHRYLLRIESSNEGLYANLHPSDHRFTARLRCLEALRVIGYQVGTGVLVGLPGQTLDDLADDLIFFRDNDVDMVSMGPYVVRSATPLGAIAENTPAARTRRLRLTLRMISVARILLRNVNITSTTALQALDPHGGELGLMAGANIVMPNVTPLQHHRHYVLYDGKPGVSETPEETLSRIETWVAHSGESIAYGEWGDPPHAKSRTGGRATVAG